MNEQEYYIRLIATAENHLQRAQEGRRLLRQGKPLTAMHTQPIGLTEDQTITRRQAFVETLQAKDTNALDAYYSAVLYQLERRYADPDKGTSELEWQRLCFLDEYERRGLQPPRV